MLINIHLDNYINIIILLYSKFLYIFFRDN